jgi:Ser/Thr protein kinase RdoA (MazF antagonist)
MLDDLRSILGPYPASVRPASEPEALGHAGGLSGSFFWRFPAGRGHLLAHAWPSDGPPRAVLEQIHGWLASAGDLGFVPVPIPARDGRTLHERGGRLWEVVPWLPGAADPVRPPALDRVRAAHAALAALHVRLAAHTTTGPSPGIVARLEELEALQTRGFTTIGAVLAVFPQDHSLDLARRWLAIAAELAPAMLDRLRRAAGWLVRRQPCLRDVRPEHFLFVGDRLTGLVDFGAMAEETVAADLARLNAEWLGRDVSLRDAALRAYQAIRPLDETEVALVPVFEDASALLLAGRWVRWHFLERRPFDDPTAVPLGLEKGLERIAALASPAGRFLSPGRGGLGSAIGD